MIKPIIYNSLKDKNKIEKEVFSKFSRRQKKVLKMSWQNLFNTIKISKQRR